MSDTPRTVRDPDQIEEWSDEISALLSQWGEISLCYGWLHNYSQRKYKRKYHHMSIPIIVLSTLTGTANFADSYVPGGYKQGFSACVGGLNIFCGILGTLMSFLKYAEVYEAHRIAAVSWSSLGRSIQIELALKDLECTREPTVKMCGVARLDNGHSEYGHIANMGTPKRRGIHIFISGSV